MSVENIGYVFGVALSLAMAYIPPFANWYNGLSKPNKAAFMLGTVFVGLAVLFGLSCAGFAFFGVVCSVAGAFSLLQLFVQVLIVNQTTYMIAVRPFGK